MSLPAALARLLPFAVAAFLAGCVLYQPASRDPRQLATVHPVPFPVAPSPAFAGYRANSPEAVPSVLAVDGAARIVSPTNAKPFSVDAGRRRLFVNGSAFFQGNLGEISCSFTAKLEVELVAGRHYEILAEMAGPDISYGVEIWMEEVGSGALVHPRAFASVHTRLPEPRIPSEPRKKK